ncbi:MAG TPA: alkene reductase [Polyangiales bacterium]
MTKSVWDPIRVGNLELPHRLVMAPMTRDRSSPTGVPSALNAEYYAQRASLALLISEGTQPSADGQGYLLTPGIHNSEQAAGWRKVSDAVHAANGKLFIQLMHVGRIAHPDNTLHHRQPVAPSAVKPNTKMFTMKGMLDIPEPRALTTEEVGGVVQEFRKAARFAIEGGADGVEIHGANGYIVQQFLSSNANLRTDPYGGSVENRARFALEVARNIADEIGPERTAIRISPAGTFNDIVETDTPALYHALVTELAKLNLAYLHTMHVASEELLAQLRKDWPGLLIVNRPGADFAKRAKDIEEGRADLISVGAMALANPDLVARLKAGAALNAPDPSTFYGGTEKGYTDYPTLAQG